VERASTRTWLPPRDFRLLGEYRKEPHTEDKSCNYDGLRRQFGAGSRMNTSGSEVGWSQRWTQTVLTLSGPAARSIYH
jgi:hypothetical protein